MIHRNNRLKKPTDSLLCKLGSLIVHLEEHAETGHPFDRTAYAAIRSDAEIEQWFADMAKLGLLPIRRPTDNSRAGPL